MYQKDTIAAISTALGEGAIGIVRMSGTEAVEIASSLFKGKDLTQVNSHTINYGHIIDPKTQQVVDEVMVSVMRAPKTYTREDIIEINCHGGITPVRRILDLLLEHGARLAEPGEFSKRAFLNGRIDLSQAEALMDIINSKTDRAMDASVKQLGGSLSAKITDLRERMLDTMATVEVTIDYPEYDDVEEISTRELNETSKEVKAEIDQLISQSQTGRIFREGINTAIIGRPNVGKSSLLNRLTGRDSAIVTDIAGTTRDTIEEYVNLRGVPLHLIDTAGIRETDELVEQIGVEKSRSAMEEADLVILIINQSDDLNETDRELLDLTQDQNRIVLLNKGDLAAKVRPDDLSEWVDPDSVIMTSMTEESGLIELADEIENRFLSGQLEGQDVNYLINSRHTGLLKEAGRALDEVIEATEMGMPVDLAQIDFTRAWELLGEITGETVQDELLTRLFSDFCLGK